MSNKASRHLSGDTGLGLGFFLGILAGILGTYLFTTESGKKLKHKIAKEYNRQQQLRTLETVGVAPKQHPESLSNLLQNIRDVIAKVKKNVNPKVRPMPVKKTADTPPSSKKKHYFKAKG